MVKWKLQAVEPDTCSGGQCRYLEWWDVEADPLTRTHTIAAFEKVCTAHSDPDILAHLAADMMLGFDGNWKPRRAYIEYQRAWFRRLNFTEWQADPEKAAQPMPETIRGYDTDPVTTGSLPAPAQAHIDALARVGGWNRRDNVRKNQAIDAAAVQGALNRDAMSWTWSGAGETRRLTLSVGTQLTVQQRQRAQAAVDVAFGTGNVTIGI